VLLRYLKSPPKLGFFSKSSITETQFFPYNEGLEACLYAKIVQMNLLNLFQHGIAQVFKVVSKTVDWIGLSRV